MFSHPLGSDADLRLLEPMHASDLFACIAANRERLRPWLTWVDSTQTVDDTRAFITETLEQFAKGLGFHAAICVNGKPVGGVGFHAIDWANRKTSIGYWIDAVHQGRGLVTRAVAAMVDHAFSTWRLNRIEIRCATDNHRSRSVPARLGFSEEGIRRQYEYMHEQYRDLVVYTMFASDWLERRDQVVPR